MTFQIHIPNKKDYDLLKAVLKETKELTGVVTWRMVLTVMGENLALIRRQQLERSKRK